MRRAVLALAPGALALLVVGVAGCNVGEGVGTADGTLWVLGCEEIDDVVTNFGTEAEPKAYRLKPTFFAGDPIEDIGIGEHKNRLRLRMQRYGRGQEDDDMLKFDIENSYEVARCVRGAIRNGVPQWRQDMISTMNGHVAVDGEDAVPWCDWSAATTDPDAGMSVDAGVSEIGPRPRIHFSTEGYTKAWLVPLSTCPMVPVVAIGRFGWLQLIDFGSAAQPDVPPEQRTLITNTDFKVNFGERLRARFHVELEDDAVRRADEDKEPLPNARIGGVLDGDFDFKLERGRVAQPFP
jgi:hypothetical protein